MVDLGELPVENSVSWQQVQRFQELVQNLKCTKLFPSKYDAKKILQIIREKLLELSTKKSKC